jgi:hypothetical protein
MREQSTLTLGIILFEIIARGGVIKVRKIHTRDNPADMMTKPVPTTKFELCSSLVGIKVQVLVTFGAGDYLLLK